MDKCAFMFFFSGLMWPAQYMQLDCGIVVIVGIIICVQIVAISLMEATSHVTNIFTYLPHRCMLSTLSLWDRYGI